ncbi:MAG: hypothetical protein N3F09_03930 [Bacteroidia bacterium]|nr:hypothetical protein [Bacteroidia bacterium]
MCAEIHQLIKSVCRLILPLAFLTVLACGKKKHQDPPQNEHPVPSVPVNVTIYPNDPQYAIHLQNPGGWVYIHGAGVQGILLYKKSQNDFVAFDRASPQNPNSSPSKIWVQNDNFTLKDTVSKATWQIVDGAPIQGSVWHLRQYATSFDGNKLIVFN